MGVSYSKLFKLLIDKKMKKKDLISAAGISSSTMAKLGKDEYVNVEVLVKICNALDANIGDIMEVIPESILDIQGMTALLTDENQMD